MVVALTRHGTAALLEMVTMANRMSFSMSTSKSTSLISMSSTVGTVLSGSGSATPPLCVRRGGLRLVLLATGEAEPRDGGCRTEQPQRASPGDTAHDDAPISRCLGGLAAAPCARPGAVRLTVLYQLSKL